ncbi:nuclear transport factor 2 family protein [Actinoplanes sp. M2I2]|uniref:nuclear transport factor 2 family protein n=1 Tax=Actinoplanes sp. M2I2 TaxID=1734444 RepID=UPI002022508F|nr:nuclear transport factor 2 family protein [Actinoplanes sp. M2I2]
MSDENLDPAQRFAVQDTLARYAFALDQHDLVGLERSLTEDATWTFTIAGGAGIGPVAGRPAILEFVRRATETQTDQRRHNLTDVVVRRSDAATAVARGYLMLTSNAGGGPSVITTGAYEWILRHVEGEWRIATLLLDMDNAQ